MQVLDISALKAFVTNYPQMHYNIQKVAQFLVGNEKKKTGGFIQRAREKASSRYYREPSCVNPRAVSP